MESWFVEAKPLPGIDAEICFLIQETFYYGPDRFSSMDDFKKYSVPLAPPKIERVVASFVRSGEALGHEPQLADYYGDVVRLARAYKRPFNSIRQYFWLRFWLWNTEQDVHVSFSWYDSLLEIESFIDAAISVESGLVLHDMDQGWELEAHAHDGKVYFRQRDPDSNETHVVASVPREILIAKLVALKSRARKIVASLAQSLGEDVWSAYVRHEPNFK